jgi:disulfide bond formation protein DsbB
VRIPSLRLLYEYAASAPERRAALVGGLASFTIAAAWFTELVLGYPPCKLCLWQRWPYYAGIPLAALAWFIAGPLKMPRAARPAFAMVASIFMVGVALGVHHSGVEWGWWAGPADCAGAINTGPARAEDLLAQLNRTRVISCSDAPFRILGLSMAGWNAAVCFLLASLAIRGWRVPYPSVQAR